MTVRCCALFGKRYPISGSPVSRAGSIPGANRSRGSGAKALPSPLSRRYEGNGIGAAPAASQGALPIGPAGAVVLLGRFATVRVKGDPRSRIAAGPLNHCLNLYEPEAFAPSEGLGPYHQCYFHNVSRSTRYAKPITLTTLSGGSLGSRVDEERGQPRELV